MSGVVSVLPVLVWQPSKLQALEVLHMYDTFLVYQDKLILPRHCVAITSKAEKKGRQYALPVDLVFSGDLEVVNNVNNVKRV